MTIDFRLGAYESTLADVECDLLLADPPYSERTHRGQSELRRELAYDAWLPRDVERFVGFWALRTRGWLVCLTDDALAPHYRQAYEAHGLTSFAPVPLIAHMPRLQGDGPASCTVWLCAARPATKEFAAWGSLPGFYEYKRESSPTGVLGAKPVELMRRLVADYSRPGELVCDPCAGGASTLIAAMLERRRAVGAELSAETFARAERRIVYGNHAARFVEQGVLDL